MNKQKILIIEDETIIALNIQSILEMKGKEVIISQYTPVIQYNIKDEQ